MRNALSKEEKPSSLKLTSSDMSSCFTALWNTELVSYETGCLILKTKYLEISKQLEL